MNRVELAKAVNQRSGLQVGDEAVYEVVNEALQELANESDWPWLETSASDTWGATDTVDLPADCKAVRFVTINDLPYKGLSSQQWASYATLGDRIRGFMVLEDQLGVVPAPAEDTDYTIYYVRPEVTLKGDSEDCLLPERWKAAVVNLACSMLHDRPEGDEKARDRFMSRYQQSKKRMLQTVKQTKRGAQVPRGRWDV